MTNSNDNENAYGFMKLYDNIDARPTKRLFASMDDILGSDIDSDDV
jgi:hypothetical protein